MISESTRINSVAKLRRCSLHCLVYLFMILIALVCFFPFYTMLISATHDNYHITSTVTLLPGKHLAENYQRMMLNKNIWLGFWNSMKLGVSNTTLNLYFSCLTAFGFSKYRFKGQKTLFGFILIMMMIPGQIGIIGFYRLISDMKLLNSYVGLILPAISNCFAVFFFKQFMDSSVPNELIEASLMDGCSEIRIFHNIVLPCMGPALVTQGVMSFIGNWNSYLTPLIILSSTSKMTLPVLLASIKSGSGSADYGAQYVGMIISVLPLLILFSFANKVIMTKISVGAAIKG